MSKFKSSFLFFNFLNNGNVLNFVRNRNKNKKYFGWEVELNLWNCGF